MVTCSVLVLGRRQRLDPVALGDGDSLGLASRATDRPSSATAARMLSQVAHDPISTPLARSSSIIASRSRIDRERRSGDFTLHTSQVRT